MLTQLTQLSLWSLQCFWYEGVQGSNLDADTSQDDGITAQLPFTSSPQLNLFQKANVKCNSDFSRC